MYNTQAQATANGDTPYDTGTSNRGYAPTIAQRQNICNNILSWSKNNYKGEEKKYVVLAAPTAPYLGHLYTTEKAAKANLERVIKCGHIEDFRKIVTFKVQKMTFNFEDIA